MTLRTVHREPPAAAAAVVVVEEEEELRATAGALSQQMLAELMLWCPQES